MNMYGLWTIGRRDDGHVRNKRCNSVGFLALAVVLLIAVTVAAMGDGSRLALCGSGGGNADTIADLVEIELSTAESVTVLDRKHVGKILAEHKLKLEGLLSTDLALKVGALIQCDVFAEINVASPSKDGAAVASVVAFDVATGVRLCDAALGDTKDVGALANAATAALESAMLRRNALQTGACRSVSIASARNVGLPAELESVPATLQTLVERLLTENKGVVFLERTRLDKILQEASLTGPRWEQLRGTAIQVDIDVSCPQTNQDLEVRVSLRDQGNGRTRVETVTGDTGNLLGVAERVRATVLGKVDMAASASSADTLYVEAKRLVARRFSFDRRKKKAEAKQAHAAAVALTEAAAALGPDDPKIQILLCDILTYQIAGEHRYVPLCTGYDMAMDVQERIFALLDKIGDRRGYTGIWTWERLLRGLIKGRKRLSPVQWSRARKLCDRFGKVYALFDKGRQRYPISYSFLEVIARDADDLLTRLEQARPKLPMGLYSRRYTGTALFGSGCREEEYYIYRPVDFTPQQKERLRKLYDRWGRNGKHDSRLESHLCAAFLVNDYAEDFPNHETDLNHHLHEAAKAMVAQPALVRDFMALLGTQRLGRCPATHREIPATALLPSLRHVAREMDRKKKGSTELLIFLDEFDLTDTVQPGSYLEIAWRQLHAPGYTFPLGATGSEAKRYNPVPGYRKQIAALYRRRYGREIDAEQPKAPALDVTAVEPRVAKCFEIQDNEVRIAEIEELLIASFEVDGDNTSFLLTAIPTAVYANGQANGWLVREYRHELLQLDPTTGETTSLGSMKTPNAFWARVGREMRVGKRDICVPVWQGVICFDRQAKRPRYIAAEQLLPKSVLTECVEVDGRLYIGLSKDKEGYLVRCDRDGTNVEVLASSGRSEKRSGLDDCLPYSVNSICHDRERGRLWVLLNVPRGLVTRSHLWECDLTSSGIRAVDVPQAWDYPLVHARAWGNGKYLFMRVVPTDESRGDTHARGFGLWNSAVFERKPVQLRPPVLYPLLGCVHVLNRSAKYKVPTFTVLDHVIPHGTSAMLPVKTHWLLAAGKGKWQLLPRSDVKTSKIELPLLDGESPFALRYDRDGNVLAATSRAVWRLANVGQLIEAAKPTDTPPAERSDVACWPVVPSPAAGLTVTCLPGSKLTMDNGATYRIPPPGIATWRGLSAGEHKVRVQWQEIEGTLPITLTNGANANADATISTERERTRTLDLGGGVPLEFVSIPGLPDFWMGKYEVCRSQYDVIMSASTGGYRQEDLPVGMSKKSAAQALAEEVTKRCAAQLGDLVVRLPSKTEWDYVHDKGALPEEKKEPPPKPKKKTSGPHVIHLSASRSKEVKSANTIRPITWTTPNGFFVYGMDENMPEHCEGSTLRVGKGELPGTPAVRLVIALDTTPTPKILPPSSHGIEELTLDLGRGGKMDFVWIPAGSFILGSPPNEEERQEEEGPLHRVTISRGFWMGRYEVTQEQYEQVMGENPSHFKAKKNPADSVDWTHARAFCDRLNALVADRLQAKGLTCCLPTEAQWEYACRAGSNTRFYTGDTAEDLSKAAWWGGGSSRVGNCDGTPHPVGGKQPNAWGLFDMLGNISEWCGDVYDKDYYKHSPPEDPTGPARGYERVTRGGCWQWTTECCRAAVRIGYRPSQRNNVFGFRVCLSAGSRE